MTSLFQVGLFILCCSAGLCQQTVDPDCREPAWCEDYALTIGAQAMCEENFFRGSCQCSCRPDDGNVEVTSDEVFEFTEWTSWSSCSRSVGEARISRSRRCIEKATNIDAPSISNCPDPLQLGAFESKPCGYGWTQWTAYSECSATCGNGQSFRSRRCASPDGTDAPSLTICSDEGLGDFQSQPCSLGPCLTWTPCDKTCGGGRRSQANCFNGDNCRTVFQDCNTQPCLQSAGQEVEHLARSFLRSITAISSPPRQRCPRDFVSSDRSVKMYASPCPRDRRQRRQAGPSQNIAQKSKRDFLFLIDESSSVGSSNFRKLLGLAEAVTDKAFCAGETEIGQTKTRVAIATFDSRQHLHMDFKASFDKERVLRQMQSINFNRATAGFTCIGETLNFASQTVFTAKHGARTNDQDTETVVILLTDGCTYCMSRKEKESGVKLIGEQLKQKGIKFVIFLVGAHSDDCIKEMKTLMSDTACYSLFEVDDWSKVDRVINEMKTGRCENFWSRNCI